MIKSEGIFPQGYRVSTTVIDKKLLWDVEYFPADVTARGTVVLTFADEQKARYAARIANAIASSHREANR